MQKTRDRKSCQGERNRKSGVNSFPRFSNGWRKKLHHEVWAFWSYQHGHHGTESDILDANIVKRPWKRKKDKRAASAKKSVEPESNKKDLLLYEGRIKRQKCAAGEQS